MGKVDFDGALDTPYEPVRVNASHGGGRVVVHYRMAAPGGAFDAADVGTYAVHMAGPLAVQPPPGGTRLSRFEVRTPRRRIAAPRTPAGNA